MRIALATCARPLERDGDFDLLAAALRRRGAEVEAPAWNDPAVDWSGFDLVVPSSTWDYHERVAEFRSWLTRVDRRSRLRNRRELIEWNLDKRYLRELEEAGVPTIPSVWAEPSGFSGAVAAVAELGWTEVVVKPVVDLGASRLVRLGADALPAILERYDEPVIVQPFQPAVEHEGELSLLFAGGEHVLTVRKRPARGDFRVQELYGGRAEPAEADAAARRVAGAAIEAAPHPALYARVDLLAGSDGALRLIELELIEPSFYLDAVPAATERVARSLLAAS